MIESENRKGSRILDVSPKTVTFDYHRIIQFSRVIPVGEETQICIRDKESNNVYDMFHARRVLHRTAYKHRVVQIIDNM
ncbi:Deoxynucleoside triphosphate triphosphohydrolase SAMHD1 [Portunus trituberculatus]|uniref:Deoxynucleoside triphosphate triphosphohydrolase SAMHD1 n=1 Tax=Portunus trituberculatus TaxID=210409 RepID=A0A5B7KK34_PORTR|nr:Deoxynucleoside triphosphate triphosphohydrolase SAMHD1 [Portunus trituberculatus]